MSLHTDIEDYLGGITRTSNFVVLQTLSESDYERTEVVAPALDAPNQFSDGAPEYQNLFVRKTIKAQPGFGNAYERLYEACRNGVPFERIPIVRDYVRTSDEITVIMDYIPGETLDTYVKRIGPGPEVAIAVFQAVCDAVTELHTYFSPPIVHRDIKPTNIIVGPKGTYLIDFSIARETKDETGPDTVRMGTRDYAPPEQYGYRQTTERSDLYALGAVLWFLLTGNAPVIAPDGSLSRDPRVPLSFYSVIETAMSFDPSDRYPSAEVLKGAFAKAAGVQKVRRKPLPKSMVQKSLVQKSLAPEPQEAIPTQRASGASDAVEASYKKKAKLVEFLTDSIPSHVLGVIWNVALTGAFLYLVFIAIANIVFGDPTGSHPLLSDRIATYGFGLITLLAGPFIAFFDTRRIGKKVYWIGNIRYRWRFLFGLVLTLVGVAIIAAVTFVFSFLLDFGVIPPEAYPTGSTY